MSAQPVHDLTTSDLEHLDTQFANVAGGDPSASPDHSRTDTHDRDVGAGNPTPPTGTAPVPPPMVRPSRSEDALLAIYADALDDFEQVRIATENRLRSLAQAKGLDNTPEAERMVATCDALKALEHGVTLDLKRAMRTHPLGPWVKATVGIGEKQAARLLATIGNPATRTNPAQLWAYCGYAPGQKLTRGVKANWSTTAKSRAYLISASCIKQAHSPYRPVYDSRRQHTAVTHPEWTAGHSHNDALRYVSKRILRDMWREARRVEAS